MFLERVGSVRVSALSVSSSPTRLVSDGVADGSVLGVHTIEVANTGTSDVYIGGMLVTPSTGLPIKAGTGKVIPVSDDHRLYVVSAGEGTVLLGEYLP